MLAPAIIEAPAAPTLLTLEEAADALRVGPGELERFVDDGVIGHHRLPNGDVRFRSVHLHAFLDATEFEPCHAGPAATATPVSTTAPKAVSGKSASTAPTDERSFTSRPVVRRGKRPKLRSQTSSERDTSPTRPIRRRKSPTPGP
jgi:excisionase family DNA binding protein